MLRVRLFGELEIELGGRPVTLPRSWRARSLLAWLAANPGAHPRHRVASIFWPDVLDASARASLRNALWALRRELGEAAGAIEADREGVGLSAGEDVWVDLREFRRRANAGEFEAAVDLYRGDLLPGLDDEWALELRERERERLGDVLEGLARAAEGRGELREAAGWARRRADLDPLGDDAGRELIRLLAAAGDSAGSLAAYEKLRQRLAAKLGVTPSAATRELVERVRRSGAAEPTDAAGGGWRPGRGPFPSPPRLARLARGPFVGRESQLARARSRWERVRDGAHGPELLLITGEAGIGKSRLAAELAAEARSEGAVVLQGSTDSEALVPHRAFVEGLGHLVVSCDAALLRELLGPRAPDLARLIPEVERVLHEATDSPVREDGTKRYIAFEAAAELLAGLSRQAPVLLLLDDLQWADKSTVALLRHVVESRPAARLLVAATYREEEVPAGHALFDTLRELGKQGCVSRIALGGMRREEVAAMLAAIVGSPPREETAAAVHVETGGNPFFVREVAMDMSEDAGRAEPGGDAASVPQSVREVVWSRLGRLEEGCRELLVDASVIGREFDLGVLAALAGGDAGEVAASLDEAAANGLIGEDAAAADRFVFSHALVRRALLERVTAAHLRRLHARVAGAIEGLGEPGERATAEIAHHLCEAGDAGDLERAVEYASRAAEQAAFRLAYADAVDLYTRCMALLGGEDPRRRELALKRAVVYQALAHDVYDSRARVTLRA
jgi:DNA-binding SARP family transcriptional activator